MPGYRQPTCVTTLLYRPEPNKRSDNYDHKQPIRRPLQSMQCHSFNSFVSVITVTDLNAHFLTSFSSEEYDDASLESVIKQSPALLDLVKGQIPTNEGPVRMLIGDHCEKLLNDHIRSGANLLKPVSKAEFEDTAKGELVVVTGSSGHFIQRNDEYFTNYVRIGGEHFKYDVPKSKQWLLSIGYKWLTCCDDYKQGFGTMITR